MCNSGIMLNGKDWKDNIRGIYIPITKENVGELKTNETVKERTLNVDSNIYIKKYTFGQAMDLALQGYIVKPIKEETTYFDIFVMALKGISDQTADLTAIMCTTSTNSELTPYRPTNKHFTCQWEIVKKEQYLASKLCISKGPGPNIIIKK